MEKIKLSIDGIKIRMERRVEIISADRIIEITPSEKQGKFFEKKKHSQEYVRIKKKDVKWMPLETQKERREYGAEKVFK